MSTKQFFGWMLCVFIWMALTGCSKLGTNPPSGGVSIDAPGEVAAFAQFKASLNGATALRDPHWSVRSGQEDVSLLCEGVGSEEIQCAFHEEGDVQLTAEVTLSGGQAATVTKQIRVKAMDPLEVQKQPAVAAEVFVTPASGGSKQRLACYRGSPRVCPVGPYQLLDSIELMTPDQYIVDLNASLGEPDRPAEKLKFSFQIPALSDHYVDAPNGIVDLYELLHSPKILPGVYDIKVIAKGDQYSTNYRFSIPVSCQSSQYDQVQVVNPIPSWIESSDGLNQVIAHPARVLRGVPTDASVQIDVNGDSLDDQLGWYPLNQDYPFFTYYFGMRNVFLRILIPQCNKIKTFVVPTHIERTSTSTSNFVQAQLKATPVASDPLSFYGLTANVDDFFATKYMGRYENRFSCTIAAVPGGQQLNLLARNSHPDQVPYLDKPEYSMHLKLAPFTSSQLPSKPGNGLPAPVRIPISTLDTFEYFTAEGADLETRLRFNAKGCPLRDVEINFLQEKIPLQQCTVCTKYVAVDYVVQVKGNFSCHAPEWKDPTHKGVDAEGSFQCDTITLQNVNTAQCPTYDLCKCNPCATGCSLAGTCACGVGCPSGGGGSVPPPPPNLPPHL